MIILGLGYITIKSDKLDDWTEFSSAYLGMQLVDKTSSTAILRMDERKQRFVITNESAASNIFGWEVNDKHSLDILSGRLDKAEIFTAILFPNAEMSEGFESSTGLMKDNLDGQNFYSIIYTGL